MAAQPIPEQPWRRRSRSLRAQEGVVLIEVPQGEKGKALVDYTATPEARAGLLGSLGIEAAATGLFADGFSVSIVTDINTWATTIRIAGPNHEPYRGDVGNGLVMMTLTTLPDTGEAFLDVDPVFAADLNRHRSPLGFPAVAEVFVETAQTALAQSLQAAV